MTQLDRSRLIYLAPESGAGGVGDYADDFAEAVRPHFAEVIEYRHSAPGTHTVRDIVHHTREIRRLVAEVPGGRAIVHSELSGGSVMPFWATSRIRSVPVTATVHDPPGMVWWPARTKFLAGQPLLSHGLHFPLRPLTRTIERSVVGDRTLFTLTRAGAQSLRERYPRCHAKASVLFVPPRPTITPAEERPKAIGFFGYVYRGKGFELIEQIREALPDDITIRVAGRGTEALPGGPGIDIVGEVNGADEDAFFDSIRALVVPYGRRSVYGEAFPASSVVTRAIAYQTPIVCLKYGSLTETEDDGGAVAVDGGARELADASASLLNDSVRLEKLRGEVEALRTARAPELVVDDFLSTWAEL